MCRLGKGLGLVEFVMDVALANGCNLKVLFLTRKAEIEIVGYKSLQRRA